jgi:cell division protein FtsN
MISFLLLPYSCSKNKITTEEMVETNFVTKKDVYLYSDIIKKTIIDEIPAFVKIKALEKKTLIIDGGNNKIYYKTDFNNSSGWVESIYLANVDPNKRDKIKPPPKNQSFDEKLDVTIKPKVDTKLPLKNFRNKNNQNYFIQVASFKNHENAKKLLKKIQNTETTLRIEKIVGSGSIFFRLVSDIYQDKPSAYNSLESIKTKYPSLSPIIITNTINNKLERSKDSNNSIKGKTEYYTIQISSFKNKEAALKLSKKMTEAGYKSRVTEAWVKGKTWFRVQHGEYKMKAIAKQVSNKIKNTYKFDPWISNIYK